MSAPHFFLDDLRGERVELTGEDARHAARVLRLRPGEEITVSDGRGDVVRARVAAASASAVEAEVIERHSVPAPVPRVIACPAVPKSGKLDLEVQKLTEIGVDEIRPWLAARSVPRWDDAKAARQGDRLRQIAREAAKQSRRAFLPEVADPGELILGDGVVVVLHEEAETRLRTGLPQPAPASVTVVTGPEGGLTPEEVERFRVGGAAVLGLGPTVLRAETAALVGVTLVLGSYGRIG